MYWILCLAALNFSITTIQARPSLPILPRSAKSVSLASLAELGDVHSDTTYVIRDLGFQGQIGQYILLTYGDTLYSDRNQTSTFRGMVSNSVAFATHDPLVVYDTSLNSNDFPRQFVTLSPAWNEDPSIDAVGITNVIETSPGNGLIFTLANHRPNGINSILGAGLATVTLNTSSYPPIPSTTRLARTLWNGTTEPRFGDVCALKASDGHIYAYGHGGAANQWVYLARAPVEKATDITSYEYWHGATVGWTSDRLVASHLNETQSVFWQINQGQIFWSAWFERYLFVYCDAFWSSTVLLRWSEKPEGPWSDAITLFDAAASASLSSSTSAPPSVSTLATTTTNSIKFATTILTASTSLPPSSAPSPSPPGSSPRDRPTNALYAAVPHPYYDPSGRTLVITFTNYPNCIQAIKVTFG